MAAGRCGSDLQPNVHETISCELAHQEKSLSGFDIEASSVFGCNGGEWRSSMSTVDISRQFTADCWRTNRSTMTILGVIVWRDPMGLECVVINSPDIPMFVIPEREWPCRIEDSIEQLDIVSISQRRRSAICELSNESRNTNYHMPV